MIKLYVLLTTLIFSQFVSAQTTETRDLAGFTRVEVEGSIEVEISRSDEFGVQLSATEGNLENFTTRLRGGDSEILVLELESSHSEGEYKADISMPWLRSVEVTGSGLTNIADFEVDAFSLGMKGSGDIFAGDISATDVDLSVAGSGDISVESLDASSVDAEIAGSGDINLPGLAAASMSIKIAGSGDVSAAGTLEDLQVTIAGSGSVAGPDLVVDTLDGVIAGSGDIDVEAVSRTDIEEFSPSTDFNELMELGSDLGSVFDEIEIEFDSEFSGLGSDHNRGGGGGAFVAELIGLVAVILIFGMPIIIVALAVTYGYRKKRLEHDTLRKFAESGQPIPENLFATFSSDSSPKSPLQSGLTLVGVGLGISILFIVMGAYQIAGVGAIPALVGVAKILAWKLEGKGQEDK